MKILLEYTCNGHIELGIGSFLACLLKAGIEKSKFSDFEFWELSIRTRLELMAGTFSDFEAFSDETFSNEGGHFLEENLARTNNVTPQNPGVRILRYHAVTLQNLGVWLTTCQPAAYSWSPFCIFFLTNIQILIIFYNCLMYNSSTLLHAKIF